jgi:hypothetical protein
VTEFDSPPPIPRIQQVFFLVLGRDPSLNVRAGTLSWGTLRRAGAGGGEESNFSPCLPLGYAGRNQKTGFQTGVCVCVCVCVCRSTRARAHTHTHTHTLEQVYPIVGTGRGERKRTHRQLGGGKISGDAWNPVRCRYRRRNGGRGG